jgi:A/G-specific adenine glycosylase
MLQQTQVVRVIEPWRNFMQSFPTPQDCADASLADIIRHWAGLGYHRRARSLHEAAQIICTDFGGKVPADPTLLRKLPGVGDYTANAVASFAFGQPFAVLDTNVGRILARALVNRTLLQREAQELAQQLLPKTKSARFNQAILDLGAQYCRAEPRCEDCPLRLLCRWHVEGGPDPSKNSAGVSKPQSTFEGSRRQARGRIIRALRDGNVSLAQAKVIVGEQLRDQTLDILNDLEREGFLEKHSARWSLRV